MRHRRTAGRRLALIVAAAAGLAVLFTMTTVPAQAAEGAVTGENWPEAIPGSYLVELKGGVTARSAAQADTLTARVGGRVGLRFSHVMNGFVFHGSPTAARRLAADPAVADVMQNQRMHATATQTDVASWGLDRIDDRNNLRNYTYRYGNPGTGVTAYVLDSGIRFDHETFGGRAVHGADFVDWGTPADDCNGHGTAVASILGGSTPRSADLHNLGVAKDVKLVAVRVMDCAGTSSTDRVIAGIDWIITDHDPGEKAVANISVGSTRIINQMDSKVEALIADGVTAVVAAGNDAVNACDSSPARVPAAITVGSTFVTDARAYDSNFGPCLDLWAPGADVLAAFHNGDTNDVTEVWGTSFAVPFVTGAAAMVLAAHPEYTPAQVTRALIDNATPGKVTDAGLGSPNRLLFVTNEPIASRFALQLEPPVASTAPGGTVTVTVRTTVISGESQRVQLNGFAPPGVTAQLDRSAVDAGGTAKLSVTLPANASIGSSYSIELVGHAPGNDATATLTVNTVQGSNGCLGSNPNRIRATPTDIYGNGITFSDIVITGCGVTPSRSSAYDITIITGCRQVLSITLIGPDGREYAIKNQDDPDDCDDNWAHRGTKNVSRSLANGTWRLRVRSFQGGEIRPWTLNLNP